MNLFSFFEFLRVALCILMRSLVVYSNEIVYEFKWHETHTSVTGSVNNVQSPHEKCFDNSIIMPTHNFWFNGRQFVTVSRNNSKPRFRVLSWSPTYVSLLFLPQFSCASHAVNFNFGDSHIDWSYRNKSSSVSFVWGFINFISNPSCQGRE